MTLETLQIVSVSKINQSIKRISKNTVLDTGIK